MNIAGVGMLAQLLVESAPPPGRALWELALVVMGAVATAGAAAGVLWKLVRPAVDAYVRQLVGPIAANVAAVREEVRPAGAAMTAVNDRARDVHAQLQRIEGRVLMTAATLQQHVDESREYLQGAIDALAAQGIKLPHHRADNDD